MSRPWIKAMDGRKIRCRPKQVMQRDRLVLVRGEPACGRSYGPGATTVDESRINCPECVAKRGVA